MLLFLSSQHCPYCVTLHLQRSYEKEEASAVFFFPSKTLRIRPSFYLIKRESHECRIGILIHIARHHEGLQACFALRQGESSVGRDATAVDAKMIKTQPSAVDFFFLSNM